MKKVKTSLSLLNYELIAKREMNGENDTMRENHGRWIIADFEFDMELNIAHWKMPCYMIHAQSSIVHEYKRDSNPLGLHPLGTPSPGDSNPQGLHSLDY